MHIMELKTDISSLEGLGLFYWKRKKSVQQTIVSFNPGGGKTPVIILTDKKKENSEEHN